jgi:hypothetical protein
MIKQGSYFMKAWILVNVFLPFYCIITFCQSDIASILHIINQQQRIAQPSNYFRECCLYNTFIGFMNPQIRSTSSFVTYISEIPIGMQNTLALPWLLS